MIINNRLKINKMNSEDTLDWFPSQLPHVKLAIGEAVLVIARQGRPINARTLLEYLQVTKKNLKRRDNKIAIQTAIDLLSENQKTFGKI